MVALANAAMPSPRPVKPSFSLVVALTATRPTGMPAMSAIRARMASLPTVTVHSYPGLDHAFARRGGDHYDAAGATLANGRTDAFLKTHLG